MGQIDLTYSVDAVSGGNLNISEDGIFSLSLNDDAPESTTITVTFT